MQQNDRIKRITEDTLVVGIDIGSVTHYARAFNFRGVELGKVQRFSNDAEGYAILHRWIIEIQDKNNKDDCIVGMEPTGHYWFCLANYLEKNKYQIAIVNPFHVKRSKEFDDNSPTKNDRKDPKVIAGLVNAGRYTKPYMPKGVYKDLRTVVTLRNRYKDKQKMIKNSVQRWLSIFFPEFKEVFKLWEQDMSLTILKNYPLPEMLINAGRDAIVATIIEVLGQCHSIKKVDMLLEYADISIGVSDGKYGAHLEIVGLLDEYELYTDKINQTDKLIEKLLDQIPNASMLLSIKGLGKFTAASFIASVGDIQRFAHPNQIKKLLGLDPVETSSGFHQSKFRISKRGRTDGRTALFKAAIPMLKHNDEFKQIHEYYTTREHNPLKKMQSVIAICCKMIRVFYAILKKGEQYDSQRLLNDIIRK